jgi:hypothetical protein
MCWFNNTSSRVFNFWNLHCSNKLYSINAKPETNIRTPRPTEMFYFLSNVNSEGAMCGRIYFCFTNVSTPNNAKDHRLRPCAMWTLQKHVADDMLKFGSAALAEHYSKLLPCYLYCTFWGYHCPSMSKTPLSNYAKFKNDICQSIFPQFKQTIAKMWQTLPSSEKEVQVLSPTLSDAN